MQKVTFQSGVIQKVKNAVLWTCVISGIKSEEHKIEEHIKGEG